MGVETPIVISLTRHGAELARKLGMEWHARVGSFDGTKPHAEFADTPAHLREVFAAGRPLIGICSVGILVRALSGQLADKWAEPPVIAVADDGSAVIPLLGGHRGGNDLARHIADILDVRPAITTASDLRLGVGLDAPPPPFMLADTESVRGVMARLNDGAGLRLISDLPETLKPISDAWRDWLSPLNSRPRRRAVPLNSRPRPRTHPKNQKSDAGEITLRLTLHPQDPAPNHLTYHPQIACLGVGASRGCPPDEMRDLVESLLRDHALSPHIIGGIYSVDVKADEIALHELGAHLDRIPRFYPAPRLDAETPRVAAPSSVVFKEIGTHSVAEASALAAAGAGGFMCAPKRKSQHTTAALAVSSIGKNLGAESMARGRLMLVGIGPGKAAWRTPEATAMVREADELVGYGLYLDLLGMADKPRKDFALGEEEARVRYALEAAARGQSIALICSGDAGVYAMGALVFELLDRPQNAGGVSAEARRIEVQTTPGISAHHAAAAKSGALLGHDFCTISLSDLLTPWAEIETRITAAAQGDFVIAFYNPVSRRRRQGLAKAKAILLAHRPATTPVVLASNLGRTEEAVQFRTLASLEVDEVDMLTLVLVGASSSRHLQVGMEDKAYTPRGYANKRGGEQ